MNVNITLTEEEFEQFKAYQRLEQKSGRGLDYIVTVQHLEQLERLVQEARYFLTNQESSMSAQDNEERGMRVLELLESAIWNGVR